MDHYKVLGLNNNATKAQIKEAFRKLALKLHPDKHSHSSKIIRDNALLRFKQASEAYEVLIDDTKRAHYNQTFRGATGASTSGFYGYGYNNNHNYYYATRNQTAYRPHYGGRGPSPNSFFEWGLHLDATLRFLTNKAFLLNLAFASVLLGGAATIESTGETLWKMHNSGKSFEEAVNSIENGKRKKDAR